MKIPVIRGKIGNWKYYSGVMSFSDIATSVTASIGEVYQPSCLDELLQRELTDNYQNIKNYILNDNERFFNAIILAIYNGDPQWLEVEFDDEEREFTNVGFLSFTGEETIFPVDGQHRVAGIIESLKENGDLKNEQVPVIFIAHNNNDTGKKKTRKLFSTLNRRAKPVGQNENIALDEDDVCSIITRDLVQEMPLFSGNNIVNSLGKQIPNANETALTSLITLYQCVDIIVKHELAKEKITGNKYKQYLLYRPADSDVERLKTYVFDVFKAFERNIDAVKNYAANENSNKASPYRNAAGGNLLFRPIAITEFFAAANILMDRKNYAIETVFQELNNIVFDINAAPWKGLVWDGTKIINRASKQVIKLLIVHMVDSECLNAQEKKRLLDGYYSALNITETEAHAILETSSRN